MTLRALNRMVRVVFVAIPIIVLCWLIAQHFAFSGILDVTNDFSQPSSFIKGLWPPGRVEEIRYDEMTDDYVQAMLIDPVTFRVQLPRAFDAMTLTVRYAKGDEQMFRLGIRTKPEVWAWELRDLAEQHDADGWLLGSVRFDRLKQYAGQGKVVDVLLNAPNVQEGAPIVLTEIRVIAERESLTWSNALRRLHSFVF